MVLLSLNLGLCNCGEATATQVNDHRRRSSPAGSGGSFGKDFFQSKDIYEHFRNPGNVIMSKFGSQMFSLSLIHRARSCIKIDAEYRNHGHPGFELRVLCCQMLSDHPLKTAGSDACARLWCLNPARVSTFRW